MPNVIIIDTNILIDLAQAGLQGNPANPMEFLDHLLDSADRVVINDIIAREATIANTADANLIRNWLDTRSGIVRHTIDNFFPYLIENGGERSIIEHTLTDPTIIGPGDTYRIMTRDVGDFADLNAPLSDFFDASDMYGERYGGVNDEWLARGRAFEDAADAAGRLLGNPLLDDVTRGCCQSNANSSPLDRIVPGGRTPQFMTFCHSASAAERRAL